jgi:hypothetical protein
VSSHLFVVKSRQLPALLGVYRPAAGLALVALQCAAIVLLTCQSQAAVVAPPVSVTASSEFAAGFVVTNMFDATVNENNLDVTPYGQGDGQWAGMGVGPFDVFMDFGSLIAGIDGLAYSQRLGADPVLDKVGRIDLWFSTSDFGGVIPGSAPDASVTITNTTNSVLTQYTFGALSFDARYVAAQFFSTPGAVAGNIGGSEFRLLTDTPDVLDPPNIELVVDRSTGELVLQNTSANPLNFIAYQINSPTAGALDASGWTSIAQNYDAGSVGPNQVDANSHWIEFTPAPRIGSLGEGQQPGGVGADLVDTNPISLGNAWIRNPVEDLEVILLEADGSEFPVTVVYEGDPLLLGDLNFNGVVDPADWPLFRDGLGGVHAALSSAQAYTLGDLDGDGDTDLVDFRTFQFIYDQANGAGALQGLIAGQSQVPEPTSLLAILLVGLACGGVTLRRRRAIGLVATLLAAAIIWSPESATAQVFTLTSPATPVGATASSEFGGTFVVGSLFDDVSLTGAGLGITAYDGASLQYAGVGPDPKEVFMDYGQSITTNYLGFAQRIGGDAFADKIGLIELWFSDVDFGGVLPGSAPSVTINITDLTLGAATSVIQPYSLGGEFAGRYVAARLTIAEQSLAQPTNNIGGNELRLAVGPSDIVLQVDRSTGALTIRNQGNLAQDLEINGYEIASADGSLLASWSGFEAGSVPGFSPGDGSGNGWERGDSSGANLLTEAYLLGTSTLGIDDVLSLGVGYNTALDAMDLTFSVSIASGNGLLLPGVIEYINSPGGDLLGDYNNDGMVDAADYTVWRDNLGAASLPNEDPAASPGVVDAADYAVWRSQFGMTSASGALAAGAAAVPEPRAWLSLVLALAVTATWRVVSRRPSRQFSLAQWQPSVVACLTVVALFTTQSLVPAATPDAIYLFGDNSNLSTENGSPAAGVGTGVGADVPDATLDHQGDESFVVLTTFRDLLVNTAVPSSRPSYVDTAALGYPGSDFGSIATGVGVRFDGVDDTLGGAIGLGFPQQGDDAFTGNFANAYSQITTRAIDGWVRPTNASSGARQDIVNDTYQFGIHITAAGTWGMNFGSTVNTVNTFEFDSGVPVASTLDANGWAHIQQRTFGAASAALYVNGELVILTGVGQPFYHAAPAAAVGSDLEISFGANLAGDANFYAGDVDNFRLLIAGDNSGFFANGANYGTFDLSLDNDFIAANVVRGDANGDGLVNGDGSGDPAVDDVAFFVENFLQTNLVIDEAGATRQVGDITSITTMADFNGDGITDVRDWFILTSSHQDAALAASLDLGSLLAGGTPVPEPTAIWLVAASVAGAIAVRRRT